MRPFGSVISVDEARQLLVDHVRPVSDTEEIPLDQAAGRVAGEDVVSAIADPRR